MISNVHHVLVSIPIGAEEEARKFYCGELGMMEIKRPESLLHLGGFWLQLGETQVHFGTEDGVDRSKTKVHVAYAVKGIDNWRKKLTALGIQLNDGIPVPGYNRFEFRDPFGNRIEFMEPK